MARILFVHGMRMQHHRQPVLRLKWVQALLRGLKATTWGRANPCCLPETHEIDLAYWADLFRPWCLPGEPELAKGLTVEDLRRGYYAFLRGLVRTADRLSFWDEEGHPRGPVAAMVNPLVHQSALYMNNGPVVNPDPGSEDGAFFQIQARFDAGLKADTRIVIAHSLGTVIAYEGLCRNLHKVDTFITIGSPIATPQLILEPLRERLQRLLNHPADSTPPWPGVRQWLNFFAPADVWSVPVKRLAPVFDGGAGNPQARVRDIEVVHGDPHRFVETHKLTSYLRHGEIHEEIARALEHCRDADAGTFAVCG